MAEKTLKAVGIKDSFDRIKTSSWSLLFICPKMWGVECLWNNVATTGQACCISIPVSLGVQGAFVLPACRLTVAFVEGIVGCVETKWQARCRRHGKNTWKARKRNKKHIPGGIMAVLGKKQVKIWTTETQLTLSTPRWPPCSAACWCPHCSERCL